MLPIVGLKIEKYLSFISYIFIFLHVIYQVSGHGRLVEPPSRSSMWRYGFKTTPNYNDMELFCGGYDVQWKRNGGKCGVCGDPWNAPSPRPNEAGGTYAKGIIVRRYNPGQVIKASVDLTAIHNGYFEFKICPHNNPSTVVSQGCLDRHPLHLSDGSGTKFYPKNTGRIDVHLKLPNNLRCSQCVFQWTYTAGNNWGKCENGESKVGCGPQETFRGCADVAVGDGNSDVQPNDYPKPAPPTQKPNNFNYENEIERGGRCKAAGLYRLTPGMTEWCNANCARGFCPASHCSCR